MENNSQNRFEKNLHLEFSKSEYRRTYLTMGVILAGMVISVINYIFFREALDDIFNNERIYFIILVWSGLFIIYEYFILRRINKYIKSGREIPKFLKVINVLDEISFPSAVLFTILYFEQKEVILDIPIYLGYFLFIILSALHLNYRLSVLMGIVAAIEYSAIVYYAFNHLDNHIEHQLILTPNIYYIKGAMFILGGVCAGYVAEEIKTHTRKAFKNLEDKDKIQKLFGQQVSKEVVESLLKQQDQSTRVEATIMFMDIRNFTNMVESKKPDEIIAYQNKIFEPILHIVNEHKGIVNQILGDGLMATFGTPIAHDDHAQSAFECGLKILNKIQHLSEEKQIPLIKIGIGIHCGEVVTGNIGNNERKQFSISGTPVIIAARLEQLNKSLNTQFIISKHVRDKINEDIAGEIMPLGLQELKGLGSKLELFKVR